MKITRVNAGQKFGLKATDWNAIASHVEASYTKGSGIDSPLFPSYAATVMLKNTSGSDVSRFGILGIDDSVLVPTDDAFKDQIVLKGVTPTVTSHHCKFAICVEPIIDGEIGFGIITGVCPVKVDIKNVDHKFCDVKASSTELESVPAGAGTIIWAESGTGSKWCYVSLGNGLPRVPDLDKTYVLSYSSQKLEWLETTTEC